MWEIASCHVPLVVVSVSPAVLFVPLGVIVGATVLQGANWALFEDVAQLDQPPALWAQTLTVRVVPASAEVLV